MRSRTVNLRISLRLQEGLSSTSCSYSKYVSWKLQALKEIPNLHEDWDLLPARIVRELDLIVLRTRLPFLKGVHDCLSVYDSQSPSGFYTAEYRVLCAIHLDDGN